MEEERREDNTIPLNGPGEEEIHLRDYLQVLLKRKWMAITTFVVIVTTATIGTFSMDPIYTATTTIQIDREPPKVIKIEEVIPLDTGGQDYYQTQYKIIQSRTIAKRVIERLTLWNHPQFKGNGMIKGAKAGVVIDGRGMERLIDTFLGSLTVEPERNSRLVRIKYSSKYPELSQQVADAIAHVYIDYNLESKFLATEKARQWLSEQLREFQARLERSEEALNSFARDRGIFSLEKDENLVLKRLEDFSTALSEAEADRIEKESRYRQISQHSVEDLPPSIGGKVVEELKKTWVDLHTEYIRLSGLYKPDYPKMVRLKAQIDAVAERVRKELEKAVKDAEIAYKISLERERLLKDTFERQNELAMRMKENAIQYNILKREVDTNKELYNGLLQRMKETGVSQGLETSNIQIVERAVVPEKPSKPKKGLNLLLAMVLGSFMGIGLAFFLEYLDNTVKDPDEIRRLFNLSTLGICPHLRTPSRRKRHKGEEGATREDLYLISERYPRSPLSEAVRTFRTSLLFSSPGHSPKTILITSSNPGEGKTFISSNLGIVLAHSGGKTLLIDGDLRRPDLHKHYSIPASPGLVEYITGNAGLEDVIRPTDIKGLFLIPSGPIPPNPPELLDSVELKDAIERFKTTFDFIVFDSAPIMHFADTLNLANKVDGTVIVCYGGKTARDDLRRLIGLMGGMKAHILGVVLNNMDMDKGSYSYYYYDYYGSREGDDAKIQI